MKKVGVILLLLLLGIRVFGGKPVFVVLETNMGDIKLKLYENTPQHTANFLKLVKEKHYDGLLFHRVIKDFMVQGGSSDSRKAGKDKQIGTGDIGYTITEEIMPGNIHKKGALSAARQSDAVNPAKRSSGEQFYIVQGKKYTDEELNAIEKQRLLLAQKPFGMKLFKEQQDTYRKFRSTGKRVQADSLILSIQQQIDKEFAGYTQHLIPADAREIYKTVGGTPFLDNEYTVFGEIVEGLDIVDKIAEVKTDKNDRPEEDVVILKATIRKK